MNAAQMYEAYLTPAWSEPSRREREFLEAGEPLTLTTPYGRVQGRRWPVLVEGRGTVLLMHGWAGRSATWLVLTPLLNAVGYHVVAFDAPGQGETRGPDGPTRSHFFTFAATLLAAQGEILRTEEDSFAAVVGHSLGASAIPYAMMKGLRAARAVLLAPTARTASYLVRWAASQGLTPEEEVSVEREWFAEFGPGVLDETDPVLLAREMTASALVVHDEGDVEAPIADGRELAAAWPEAIFEPTTGLGHRRLLLSRAAMGRIVEFVSGGS